MKLFRFAKIMPFAFAAFLSAEIAGGAAPASSGPDHLRCEGRENPLGIDAVQPRFSWWISDSRPGALQTAFEIEVSMDGERVWSSGRNEGNESVDREYAGPALASKTRYDWRVRTWDADGGASAWSETAWFETGLLVADEWQPAEWIGHPPRFTHRSPPAAYLRKEFELPEASAKRARLYVSARGLLEAHLNGERVGEDHLVPGWTDYGARNQYLTYDVTDGLAAAADNAIGIVLADGWHNGRLKWKGHKRNWYGEDTSAIALLVVELEDGEIVTVATGPDWRVATGPILESDLYNGEKYDARAELGEWSKAGYDAADWLEPRIEESETGPLVAKVIEPVRTQETLKAKIVGQAANGEWVFDFGQNLVGWAKIRMTGVDAQTVTLRFAEMLNPDGTLYVENLRSAEAVDRYTFADDKPVEWEPRFTFHGFRYVGLSGVSGEPAPESIEAIVLHTDAPMTGEFSCSNELLNQLQRNIVWGQKGNYLEVPTDCPQRDERLGWTGDAQVFVRTATYNMNVSAFFEKWMADMRDAQQPNGEFPFYAPRLDETKSSPAWGDAGVICPWVIYERYGNERILADNFEAMRRWVDFQENTSDDLIRPEHGFGDWLAIDAPTPGEAPTPRSLIGTAYFAHTAHLVSEAASVLGKKMEAERYAALETRVKAAFNREFVREDGHLKKETQTGYLLALGFDLLPEEGQRARALDALLSDLESRDWHLSTGFVGTGLLMPVLSKHDRNDAAYRILLQETYPGWLYSIRQGATTMWERWNSYTHADGFGPVSMNSFNHYAYGAVGEWMYAVIAGIDALEPGFKKILLRPQPGGGLTWASGKLESPYGEIASSWKLEDGAFELEATIPANTTAVIELPNGERHEVGAGSYEYSVEM